MKKHSLFPDHAKGSAYAYGSPLERENTVRELLETSALARKPQESYWEHMRRYYDGIHDIRFLADDFAAGSPLPWKPAQCPDGFLHVESQIDAMPPDFTFSPRDGYPEEEAKAREAEVRRICERADLASQNTANERRLGIEGSAVWKVDWDGEKHEVTVEAPPPQAIYADPTAANVDDCEYIACVRRMHKQKAKRVFARDFETLGEAPERYLDEPDDGPFTVGLADAGDDTVTVTEFWFRQSADGKDRETRTGKMIPFKAGDVALSVLIGGREVRYVPRYYQNTVCTHFPFVIYGKVPNEGSLWGKSELEPLIPLIDAADRDLAFAQYNAAFTACDVILAEENAFADGEVPENTPGAIWRLRPGMTGKVQRLASGAGHQAGLWNSYALWESMMQAVTGNFDVRQGKEPASVTTAAGMALLNERAASRQSLKKVLRAEGFRRLYRLIDCTALEFCGQDKGLIGTDGKALNVPEVTVSVTVGDGLSTSKSFMISALSVFLNANINKDNYIFFKAYAELAGLPMAERFCAFLDARFASDRGDALDMAAILAGLEEEKDKEEGI